MFKSWLSLASWLALIMASVYTGFIGQASSSIKLWSKLESEELKAVISVAVTLGLFAAAWLLTR